MHNLYLYAMHILDTPIEYLKGVGPTRAELLKQELHIFTFSDLLYHFPFRYSDRSQIISIADIRPEMPYIQIKGKIIRWEEIGEKKAKRLIGYLQDETGIMELVWFKGIRWIKQGVKLNTEYLVFAKPNLFQHKINLVHPELEDLDKAELKSTTIMPVYSTTEKLKTRGLNSKAIVRLIHELLLQLKNNIPETLSNKIMDKFRFPTKKDAIFQIHFPNNLNHLKMAQDRLKFEELFFLQLHLLKTQRVRKQKNKSYVFEKIDKDFYTFYNQYLPFELTEAQKRVLKEIRKDVKSGLQMNRLLQGDVGSGKTMVAILTILMATNNQFQACLMVPTEILAQQHFAYFEKALKAMNLKVAILTGSTSVKEKKQIISDIENHKTDILIGTHALLEDHVRFQNLGLVIIDEQHRFGVSQRAKLWQKETVFPHVLVMTATPIPRTLSLTLYGDLDVSIIDELPPGRKEIKTIWRSESSRLRINQFMREQIELGRQVYIVYPLIQESEKLDYKDLMDGYNAIVAEFPLPQYQVSVVHGQMKSEDKEYEMKRFLDGIAHIMVATTVIEVGVDVPNASVMVIESAERFGLSQLHQLRGRVGRGAEQSYCILLTGHKISNEGKIRMETMVSTTDGFKVSEVDLQLRGPGEMMGTKQSGRLEFKIADIIKDGKILEYARKEALLLLELDEHLNQNEHQQIAKFYHEYEKDKINWSRVG